MTDSNVVQIPPAAAPDKQRTITLTNARPVLITEKFWPVIAEGKHHDEHPGGFEDLKVDFRIRREVQKHQSMWEWHPRHLIHGKFYYWYDDQPDRWQNVRVGRLLSPRDDIEQALREVGEEMRVRVLSEYMHRWVRIALDDCFANLGPQLL